MHEQSIVESLLSLAIKNAEQANASRIRGINVVVGELSGVVEESVNFYFSFLSKDTIAAQATINYRRIPATLRCRTCRTVFDYENAGFNCPECHDAGVDIIGGRELYLESLEVE
jgi:hydrogenase nickel incorporation protein HypA/HybF